ncbi:hypothetical protein RF11_04853 [Thelohanellus kitauei]|uniref:Uncharacterized protein n=1 Tax=Thelohanellus kitauei TaxID=669202 RepID=A0A0C2MHX4_THEKT|nr:hypothetical protein RF11_04853 [Thelohanellus kitauei]
MAVLEGEKIQQVNKRLNIPESTIRAMLRKHLTKWRNSGITTGVGVEVAHFLAGAPSSTDSHIFIPKFVSPTGQNLISCIHTGKLFEMFIPMMIQTQNPQILWRNLVKISVISSASRYYDFPEFSIR